MKYKVYRIDKWGDEIERTFDSSYFDEVSANVRARDLYHRGVYDVEVLDYDGKQSTIWHRPIEGHSEHD